MNIPPMSERMKRMDELIATTRYDGPPTPKDEHGMPIVAPEPDDPDDE